MIFAGTDWRLACPLALWIVVYVAALAVFVPRIRRRSEELAHMRATLTGRIVDSYTNIQTVKLFAHLEREDEHAKRGAGRSHRRVSSPDAADHVAEPDRVSISNSVLLVTVGAIAVWLWMRGAVTLGDIAIATGLGAPRRD